MFHRIQYAKTNRWEPPIDLASDMFSNGSFQAIVFGPCCPQRNTGIYMPLQDEQCLYLNIFTPSNKSNESLLPVLVWIHGGGLTSGCSSQSIPILYNGTNIIANSPQQPIIIVTINYRLGVLADMYLTELIKENSEWPTAGNYNFLDILSALRWININIRDYGGNPNNVLLFGESSGGKSVVDIGALKGSSNLYQHIISQSGGFSSSIFYSNKTFAMQRSNTIVEQMNCTNHTSKLLLVCLRNSSIHDLIMVYGNRPSKSVIDGYFLPYHPLLAIQNGKYNQNISKIIGANKYEGSYCPIFPEMNSTLAVSIITDILGQNRAPTVINYYQFNNCSSNINATNRCCDITRSPIDAIIGCSIRRIYNNIYLKYNQEQHKLFWYNMDYNPGICPKLSKEEGAGLCLHASELPLVFGTESDYRSMNPVNCTWDNHTRTYSNQIISHWISMASKGEPLNQWPKYDPSEQKYLQFTPFHEFSVETWNNDCLIFDQIEQDDLSEMFGNSSPYEYGNRLSFARFVILFLIFYYYDF
ncbi:unnamed protein product [Rotaria sp. Silwood1]|nr:unnamed protein product [Rotaria sp. Silwood1]CAF4925886.1 unnamed protein product [Rotaria sp. Silwood1]